MKTTTLGHVRQLIRNTLTEAGGAKATKPQPYDGDKPGPGHAYSEELGSLASYDIDTDNGSDVSSHLRDPQYEEEDCYGPVPPNAEQPYAIDDPFVRDSGPVPTPGIRK